MIILILIVSNSSSLAVMGRIGLTLSLKVASLHLSTERKLLVIATFMIDALYATFPFTIGFFADDH